MAFVSRGFGGYEDVATKTTPLSGLAGVPLDYDCDATGTNGRETKLPDGVIGPNALWNPATSRVDLSQLELDDEIFIRLDFVITPASPNTTVRVFFNHFNNVGDPIFTSTLTIAEIKTAAANPEGVFWPDFVGPAIVDGTIGIQIECSNNFDLEIGGVVVFVLSKG